MKAWVQRLLCLALVLGPTPAVAAETRYALLIGANVGNAAEQPLRFAGDDAERLAGGLKEVGGFVAENVVVLFGPDSNRVRSALARLNARIRAEQDEADEALLFVYFSGHADALSLHLAGEELPWDDLRNLTSGSPARARILVVDACRSGSVTRVKGLKLDRPFALPASDGEMAQGFAILSSATAGEDAQESDVLGGSVFTHHLVAALRGLGDANRDGEITLDEVFSYASQRTIASSAATFAGVQHPTYAYDLKGRRDLVLATTGHLSDLATLALEESGQYHVHRGGPSGSLELEANVGEASRQVWLKPGRLYVRRRLPERLFEGEVTLQPGVTARLDMSGFRVVEYAQLVRKGGSQRPAFGVVAGGILLSPLLEDYSPTVGGALLLSMEATSVTLDAKLELGHARATMEILEGSLFGYGLLLGARKAFDFDWVALSAGVRLGASLLRQSFDTTRTAPSRSRLVPLVETLVRADAFFPHGWILAFEVDLRVSHLTVQVAPRDREGQTMVQPGVVVALGKMF